jgi:predicted alpha-1,2-mannosidase
LVIFGGKENFALKLDSLFTITSEVVGKNKSLDISGLIGQYAHGNEPRHHTAYLFNYADKHWRTQELINKIRADFYTDKPDGLCGNEDCGQMSAWYILNAMGFYPVCPGDTKYSVGVPLFDYLEIPLSNGKIFRVVAKNRTDKNTYVKRVLLDGKSLTTPFINHKDITDGKTLIFEMGAEPVIF